MTPLSHQFSHFEKRDYEKLEALVGSEDITNDEAELLSNACDAYISEWRKPDVVIWPESTEEVSRIIAYANGRRIPVVPRGGGSSLSGNVVPVHGGIVLSFRKMAQVLEVRERDRQVIVQPGIVYADLNKLLSKYKLFFPPDPASSSVCTIGGMVANNSSGLRAVKYGVTKDYVLQLEAVLANGAIISPGSNAVKTSSGYDLVRLFVGSEGTLGVITQITLKLSTIPEAFATATVFFSSPERATEAVQELVATGLTPAAIEFFDRKAIRVVDEDQKLGLPDAEAMLLVEFDGPPQRIESDLERALSIFKRHEVTEVRRARDENERGKLWAARKGAYPALLKTGKTPVTGDVIVPISKMTELLKHGYEAARKHGVEVVFFGHCGDGNLHPTIMSDKSDPDHWKRANAANEEVVMRAIELGGSSSAEHGIGTEKRRFMPAEHGASLEVMKQIKMLLDPNNILNPGKFFE